MHTENVHDISSIRINKLKFAEFTVFGNAYAMTATIVFGVSSVQIKIRKLTVQDQMLQSLDKPIMLSAHLQSFRNRVIVQLPT